jgi:PAS domain S-box-containing protein
MRAGNVNSEYRPSKAEDNRPTVTPAQHFIDLDAKDGFQVNNLRLPMAAEIALGALSTLPTPIIVLSTLKTVVLANVAVARLLGIDQDGEENNEPDTLVGQTLSQLGIDMVSDGVPIWVSWEKFLDNLAEGLQSNGDTQQRSAQNSGSTTPTIEAEKFVSTPDFDTQRSKDTVVDVVISSHHDQASQRPQQNRRGRPGLKSSCRMIISIWNAAGQRFFTLTFTSSFPRSQKSYSSTTSSTRNRSSHSSVRSEVSQTNTAATSAATSQVTSPGEQINGAPFPSLACPPPSTLSDFQKVLKMKNAMLNAVEIPLIAMWRDESVVFPNLAARRLLAVDTDPTSDDSYDFMSRFKPWAADFSRELLEDEYPIVSLCRTQKAFTNWVVGMVNEKTGKKTTFDVSGHPVFDERSGDFLAGLIAFKDVTAYTERIAHKVEENEEHFRQMCDLMPQMIWTTTPDGLPFYFSKRFYEYTGLTPAQCLGHGWITPFHPEDLVESTKRWQHSLSSGDEYFTEYRCQSFDGQWRWMLGRALPLRDHETGAILRWFGTCTDIQDIVDARQAGQRSRQQLLDVLKHSQMSLWILNHDLTVEFHEGGFAADLDHDAIIGAPILDLLQAHLPAKAVTGFTDAIGLILDGKSEFEIVENEMDSTWYRSKIVPLRGDEMGTNGVNEKNRIIGAIVIGSDVTSMRHKEQENIKLLANETAAKEASKMKSSFLANMSHEIRTPIAGVLGMSELLMDTSLDTEQHEFAQNIQRSANSLLTVINDILDFSKIESGRLDIEEVQFSLGVVLGDVAKMLSYAAARKGLEFSSDIQLGPSQDYALLGDPGRIRQILINLLTNSIKFTTEGFVKLSATIIGQTTEVMTVEFYVEDSGVGIEEEVKKRLFKPFSQADSSTARRFGGTGLGLTICKNLVELMHGTIRLDSKLDAGTRASFVIPFKKVEYQSDGGSPMLDVGLMPDRMTSDLSLSLPDSPNLQGRALVRTTSSIPTSISPDPEIRRHPQPKSSKVSSAPQPMPNREHIHILVVEGEFSCLMGPLNTNSDRQPRQSTDRAKVHQIAQVLCCCCMEWQGGIGVFVESDLTRPDPRAGSRISDTFTDFDGRPDADPGWIPCNAHSTPSPTLPGNGSPLENSHCGNDRLSHSRRSREM